MTPKDGYPILDNRMATVAQNISFSYENTLSTKKAVKELKFLLLIGGGVFFRSLQCTCAHFL